MGHWARVFEDRWTVDAPHDHLTSLEDVSIDSHWLAYIMDGFLLDHGLGLWLIHWNEPGRCQLVVSRSNDVLSLDWCWHGRLRYRVHAIVPCCYLAILQTLASIVEGVTPLAAVGVDRWLVSWHHLCSSWERFLLLRQLLNNLAKVDDFLRLNVFRWQLVLLS